MLVSCRAMPAHRAGSEGLPAPRIPRCECTPGRRPRPPARSRFAVRRTSGSGVREVHLHAVQHGAEVLRRNVNCWTVSATAGRISAGPTSSDRCPGPGGTGRAFPTARHSAAVPHPPANLRSVEAAQQGVLQGGPPMVQSVPAAGDPGWGLSTRSSLCRMKAYRASIARRFSRGSRRNAAGKFEPACRLKRRQAA